MTAEPFAWAYQNANTEHQYLVWHKQEGGRNWVPLFTLQDVQEAILAEREACAKVCDAEANRAKWNWDNDISGNQPFWNGGEQLASSCAAAIRARSNT